MRLLTVLVGFLMLTVLPAQGDDSPLPAFTVVTEQFPPYNYQVGGEARGLSVEVLQAVLDELNAKPGIQFMPWSRAYRKALAGKNVLIFSIARIPEREHLFHWVGEIAPYRTGLYKLRENPLRIRRLEDARTFEVGVTQQDVIYSYLRSEGFTRLDVIGSDLLNIQKLKHKRIPLIAYDEAAFNFAMQQGEEDPNQFERVLGIQSLTGSLYMAFSQDSDPELVARFQAALERVKAEGRYGKILQRYFDQVNVESANATPD